MEDTASRNRQRQRRQSLFALLGRLEKRACDADTTTMSRSYAFFAASLARIRMCNSRSCCSVTAEGVSIKRS